MFCYVLFFFYNIFHISNLFYFWVLQASRVNIGVINFHSNVTLPDLKIVPQDATERRRFKINAIYYTMATLDGLRMGITDITQLFPILSQKIVAGSKI